MKNIISSLINIENEKELKDFSCINRLTLNEYKLKTFKVIDNKLFILENEICEVKQEYSKINYEIFRSDETFFIILNEKQFILSVKNNAFKDYFKEVEEIDNKMYKAIEESEQLFIDQKENIKKLEAEKWQREITQFHFETYPNFKNFKDFIKEKIKESYDEVILENVMHNLKDENEDTEYFYFNTIRYSTSDKNRDVFEIEREEDQPIEVILTDFLIILNIDNSQHILIFKKYISGIKYIKVLSILNKLTK